MSSALDLSIKDISDPSWEDLMEMMSQDELNAMSPAMCTFSIDCADCSCSACGASGC